MVVVLILLGSIQIVGLLVVLFATAKAPFGYEDDKGFHKSEAESPTASETPV